MDLFSNVPTWQIFVVISLLLMISEVFAAGFVLFPIGLGFLLSAYFTTFSDSMTVHLLILAIAELIVIYVFTKFVRPKLKTEKFKTNVDSMLGKTVEVITTIPENSHGYIKLYGDEWSAIAEDHSKIEQGSQVEIVKLDGNKVIVKRI